MLRRSKKFGFFCIQTNSNWAFIMITDRKQAKADLRRSYNVYLQLGLIVALLSIIGLVRINLYSEPPAPPTVEEQE